MRMFLSSVGAPGLSGILPGPIFGSVKNLKIRFFQTNVFFQSFFITLGRVPGAMLATVNVSPKIDPGTYLSVFCVESFSVTDFSNASVSNFTSRRQELWAKPL